MAMLRKKAARLAVFLIVSLLVDSAAHPVATGRFILSSEEVATSSSSSAVAAAAELQQFLSEKGYGSVSNSASSELAVIGGNGGSMSGSGSSTSSSRSSSSSGSSSSSSSSAIGAGAVGFNVVLGAPAPAGRKMLQSTDEVTFINAFLVALAEALGVPRTSLTATSFTDQGATFIFDVVVDVSQLSQTVAEVESRASSIASGSIVVNTAATYSVAAASVVSTPTSVLTVTLFNVDQLARSLATNTNSVLSFPDASRTGTALYVVPATTAPPPTTPSGPVCDLGEAAIIALNPFYSDWASSGATTPCSFTGVSCTAGVVTEIIVDAIATPLDNASADLSLPPEWSCLTALENVTVTDANFTGPLPPEWSVLTNLTHLNVADNDCTGPFPASWADTLVSLETLDVSLNELTGTLPYLWCSLTTLEILNVAENKFNGTAPFGLPKVKTLNLAGNEFTGSLPLFWTSYTNLVTLNVADNDLTGTLPSIWCQLTTLETFILADNKFNGSAPTALPLALKTLNLAGNELEGTISSFWSFLTNLEILNVAANDFNDTLPEYWRFFTNLETLNVAGNGLRGELYSSWGSTSGLVNLKTLNVADNELKKSLPLAWSSLTKLEKMDVSDNKLTGVLPSEWSTLTSLVLTVGTQTPSTGSFNCVAPSGGWGSGGAVATCLVT